MPARRVRRSADEARHAILEVAERQLMQGGPEAVRIQAIARELGVTDAAVHHHFGTRKKLLTELLRFGGRRLREAVQAALPPAEGPPTAFDLDRFLARASQVMGERGYARLALWLTAGGWRSSGRGIWDELAIGLATLRGKPRPGADERHLAALVALVVMAEPVFGDAAQRSVSLPADAASTGAFRAYLRDAFARLAEPG